MIKAKYFNLKKSTLAVALCLSSQFSVAGSISTQMDDAFNALVNVTEAGAYDTARRGVVSGGQAFIKFPTKRVSVTSATAPKISAGCGGIDMYGGSFSFINADEMVETFQAIGANALGYGVKLAITSACNSCEQVMTSLEKTAQFINSINIDSCQAAQGIVQADAWSSANQSADNKSKLKGVSYGSFEDAGEAWGDVFNDDTSASEKMKKNQPDEYVKEITGNIAWRAFKETSFEQLFGGDDEFLQFAMTMTGTVIINNPSTDSETSPKPTIYNGHGVKLVEMIDGAPKDEVAYKIYSCNTVTKDGCLEVSTAPTKDVKDIGLSARVLEELTGTGGLIESFGNDQKMTDAKQKTLSFKTSIGDLCIKKMRIAMIDQKNKPLALNIAAVCSNRMALEAAMAQVTSYLDAARAALQNAGASDSQQKAKDMAQEVFNKSLKAYRDEYVTLGKDNSYLTVKKQIEDVMLGSTGKTTQGAK